MRIYMIPGLGADKRMYDSLVETLGVGEVLEFTPPLPGENLESYARRFLDRIQTDSPFVLIGTSLGGIICMELVRHIRPLQVIILASVKHRGELPWWIRMLRYVPIYRIIPGAIFKKAVIQMAQKGKKGPLHREAELIVSMAKEADEKWIRWGIHAVIQWRRNEAPHAEILHLHGNRDLLFPLRFIHNAEVIRGGTHVMNLTMAPVINQRIKKVLEERLPHLSALD